MAYQKILTKKYVEGIFEEVERGEGLDRFLQDTFPYDGEKLLVTPQVEQPADLALSMVPTTEGDFASAVALYEAYSGLKPLQAINEQFWASLSLTDLFPYMRERWNLREAKDLRKSILNHFTFGAHGMMRHGLAGLWWLVHLTVDEQRDNRYELTELLFRNFTLRFVRFGVGRVIQHKEAAIGILQYIKDHETEIPSLESVANGLTSYFNKLGAVKQLTAMDRDFFYSEMEKHIVDFKSTTTHYAKAIDEVDEEEELAQGASEETYHTSDEELSSEKENFVAESRTVEDETITESPAEENAEEKPRDSESPKKTMSEESLQTLKNVILDLDSVGAVLAKASQTGRSGDDEEPDSGKTDDEKETLWDDDGDDEELSDDVETQLNLMYYRAAFSKMPVSNIMGQKAPHKAILLLTIMEMIENGRLNSTNIKLTDELNETFCRLWGMYVGKTSVYRMNIAMPYFHLQHESFWRLIGIYEAEKEPTYHSTLAQMKKKKKDRPIGGFSIKAMRDTFAYAEIDGNLLNLLKNSSARAELRNLLIAKYLPTQSK